jgi:hypothetical protein
VGPPSRELSACIQQHLKEPVLNQVDGGRQQRVNEVAATLKAHTGAGRSNSLLLRMWVKPIPGG